MTLYAYATEPHYRAHLEPVVAATGAEWGRGGKDDVHIVASYKDLLALRRAPTILFEHGAGQSYSNAHPSYAGGNGREQVVLFICPNEASADRNRLRYPAARVEVVGSPRLEQLRQISWEPEDAVAISFHWDCRVAPESRSAFPHFRSALEGLGTRFKVLGHAHPRMWHLMEQYYRRIGIEPVQDFTDVVRRAKVYVCDNSSSMYEWAALDRPVVLMDAPWYRRDVEHGLRFWEHSGIGVHATEPADLPDAIGWALDEPSLMAANRRAISAQVYPYEDATARAVAAIQEVTR